MFKFREYDIRDFKFSILITIILLNVMGGYLMQYLTKAEEKHFEKQLLGLLVGMAITAAVSIIDYHFICKLYIVMYVFNMVLLAMVKFSKFGAYHYKAKRWLRFPDASVTSTEAWLEIQPSELSKIIMILFIAKFFIVVQKHINKWYTIVIIGILAVTPIVFIFDQPDLSSSMVLLLTFLVMLFATGLTYKVVIPSIAIGVPSIVGLLWYVQQPFQKLLKKEYQIRRIMVFLHPELDTSDLMWQQDNAGLAIRSGGMVGKLFSTGADKLECNIVPGIESDFIFAAIAEGYGFVGCCLLFALYMYLVFNIVKIAKNAKDKLGTYIAIGAATMFMIQFFFNIGVATSLLPNTGIPLPFVSSGLSSLLSNLLIIGIVLNIGMQQRDVVKEDEDDMGGIHFKET